MKHPRHSWTIDEIKKVTTLWETSNPEAIAGELNISIPQLNYIAKRIRVHYPNLVNKKRRIGELDSLIKSALG